MCIVGKNGKRFKSIYCLSQFQKCIYIYIKQIENRNKSKLYHKHKYTSKNKLNV